MTLVCFSEKKLFRNISIRALKIVEDVEKFDF